MQGEYRGIPRVKVSVDGKRLKVTGARVVWPKEQDLDVRTQGSRIETVLQNPGRFTALYLKLAKG
jgi:hypothetical protein